MKEMFHSQLRVVVGALCVMACASVSVRAQTTYTPNNWVNDPFATNANYTVIDANTSHPTYQNTGLALNSLFGNSPIGATIMLTNPGDTVILTSQITLAGNPNPAGNVQFRVGLVYKGANATDTGWGGYLLGNPTGGGGGGLYVRNIPNSGIYASGTGATQPATPDFVFTSGWGAATYDFMLSVTRLSSTATLMRWKLAGQSPNTYHYSGRYTNNAATTQGGFSFDQVGLLGGASTFNAAGIDNLIIFSNVLVTVGSYGDGLWANDSSGDWSVTNNWVSGVAANGSGFIADFSQVSLAADRTVTLDSSRTIGSLRFGATSGSTNNWFLNASGGSTLTLDSERSTAPSVAVNQNTATINLPLVSSNGLAKTGAGTVVLRGNNTFVGALNLNGGALNFLSLANLPIAPEAISTINFGGGTLQWASGNTFDISSVGIPINFTGNAGIDTGPNNVTFANSFGDGGVGGLTKLGTGTLTLQNYVAYTGATTISNGTLALGVSGNISTSTNISVGSGATFNVAAVSGFTLASNQKLSGSGTVVGSVSDTSGSTIAPGDSAGTLTINGGLNLNGGGALNYELSDVTTTGGGVNDLTVVTGNLNIAGQTTINVTLLNGAPGLGTYTLFTYNTFSGDVANLTAPPGFVVTNNTTAKTIGLLVTHVPAVLTWHGDGVANTWDTGTTADWLQSGTNQVFFTGDSVTFDNTGSASPPVSISNTVSPSSVTVNASQDYTFDTVNSGGIGTGRLTKSGTGTLTLETDNAYSGPTVINAGTLQVGGPNLGGASGTLGTGPTTNNGALVFNRAADYTYTNVIRGTGSITNIGSSGAVTLSGSISGSIVNMAGAGDLVLSSSNSYTGQTIVSSGSLNPRNSAALGTSAAGTVVQSGGRLYIDANIDIAGEAISVAGTGADGLGALRKGGNGVTTFGGQVTLTADASITSDGGSTLNLTNASGISGTGFGLTLGGGGNGNISGPITLGIGSLTKTDGGTWTLARTNTYTGKTFINGGTVTIPAVTALGPLSASTPDYVALNGGSLSVTTNITFDDGLRGFTANGAAGGFNVGAGLTLVISNAISGAGTITKSGSGTLVLSGPNTFSGTLNVDSAANALDDGIVRIAHSGAIANVLSPIAIRNTQGGTSTLQLDGSNGNINAPQEITLNGRSPGFPAIVNVAGTNTLAGGLTLGGGGGQYRIQSDSGLLTLGGIVSNSTIAALTLTFQGNANLSVTGVIQDDGTNAISVVKIGNGSLTLMGVNNYAGSTTVNGGSLGGIGTINGPVTVASGGTLSPGASIGTLTINNTLSLNGNTFIEVNKNTGTRDQIVGVTGGNYNGTLTVSNQAGTLAPNDSFQIFPAGVMTGNFTSISPAPGGGLSWNFDPATGVLSVVGSGIPTTPTNISFSVSGGNINLSWPPGYVGWILQSQTNALNVGIRTNPGAWSDVTGSASVTTTNIPINLANPTVFYRLRFPN